MDLTPHSDAASSPEAWSEARKRLVIQHFVDTGTSLGLGGRARVACEGVNCTISGEQEKLEAMAASLVALDPAFSRTEFKYIRDLPPARHFTDFTVFPGGWADGLMG